MYKTTSLILFLFLFQSCLAQKNYTTNRTASGKAKNAYERGLRMSFNGQMQDALFDFEKALRFDPRFIDAQIEWANVKNQLGLLSEAELGYEKALAIDSLYDSSIYYSLAIVEFEQRKYAESTLHFERYLNSGKTSEKRKENAEAYINSARFAVVAIKNPVPFEPISLGPGVNTSEAEYLPSISADGETLIYTAVRNGQEDFYRSRKVNDVWQSGEPILALNTLDNEGAQSLSADGKSLVFTACYRRDGLGGCDIYYSEFKFGKWTPVRNIGAPINTAGWDSQPSISPDGKTLYFVSDRKGGLGGKDIWVSQRDTGGKWSQPWNLGSPINTTGNDQSPFIHADGQSLYFMSNGHPGMGGFDLFVAKMNQDGTWGEPKNLGYPINTEANEGALSVSLDGKTAYFATDLLKVRSGVSSFDNPQGKGSTDIYSFELYPEARPLSVTYVQAKVIDAESLKELQARVEIADLGNGKVHASSNSDENGEFLVTLPLGKDYALNVSKDKYLFHSEHFALLELTTVDRPYRLKIALVPIPDKPKLHSDKPVSAAVILKNVFFETGSAELKSSSLLELGRLRDFLNDNPSLRIQINGHTDDQGGDDDNLLLSNNRAKAVYDFLVKNGIKVERLRYKGYGESLPVATNTTDEGRKQNRRTDFVIIE